MEGAIPVFTLLAFVTAAAAHDALIYQYFEEPFKPALHGQQTLLGGLLNSAGHDSLYCQQTSGLQGIAKRTNKATGVPAHYKMQLARFVVFTREQYYIQQIIF